MYKIFIIFIVIYTMSVFSINLDKAKFLAKQNNQKLHILNTNINVSKQDEILSSKWKNPIIGFGANDLLLNDLASRDKEAMQTQFITFTQVIPIGQSKNISENLSRKDTIINKYLLENESMRLNSTLTAYFYQSQIIKNKLKLIKEYKKNIQEVKAISLQQLENDNNQIQTINNDIKIATLDIKKQNLQFKLNSLKYKIEEITNSKINKINTTLSKLQISKINKKDILNKHPFILALKEKFKKSQENIKLQKANKLPDLKLSAGFYQREAFQDYLSFNIAISLPLYNIENQKIIKAKKQRQKQKYLLEDMKNKFKLQMNILMLEQQTSLINYRILNEKIIKQKKLISNILSSYNSIKKISITAVIKNINTIIDQNMLALDELNKFYNAKAKIKYFKGEKL